MLDPFLLEPFLWRAITAGTGVAVIAGIIGCFVVWRRMAYFGDSLAHSALLGIVFGLVAGVSVNLGTIIVCTTFALSLLWLQNRKILATDTLLGILSHSALSLGLVAMALLNQRTDLYAYLFGDILTATAEELGWIYGGGIFVLVVLLLNWSSLVLMTIHDDLAKAENVNTFLMQLLLMLLITLVVAVSIRIVGILLITSMLIIPAATARQIARTPESMAAIAALFGMAAVLGGIFASVYLDTPSGPSIVGVSAALFVVMMPLSALLKGKSIYNK